MPGDGSILTINVGSSSLKAAVYAADVPATPAITVRADRVGAPEARVTARVDGRVALDRPLDGHTHAAAVGAALDWLETRDRSWHPAAISHRVVHGARRTAPQRLTPDVVADLHRLAPIDPDHLPQAIETIELTTRRYPDVAQIACFDTAFHQTMPPVATRYPLPARFEEAGVRRYGFHGLSCESILDSLRQQDAAAADGRLIVAHLGNGASLTAVHHGHSVDTTMGFSPAGGIVMGTRTGDLDPGVLLYAMRSMHIDQAGLNRLVNHEGGLLAVSGTSADMRDLLSRETGDPNAAAAVALFCYSARKAIGALMAALGGLETLVFTGGIGEHAAPVRARILTGLDALGIAIDPLRNRESAPVVSTTASRVIVRVMATDEDRVLARHAARLLEAGTA